MLNKKSTLLSTIMAGLLMMPMAAQVSASESVAAGTVLSKENIDELKDKTFDGHKISSLLSDKQEMMIRDYNLKMKLEPFAPVKLNPNWVAADKNYGGSAQLDSSTHMISNYKGGQPFHNVSKDDPEAGWKIAWNQYYANPVIGDTWAADAEVFITETDNGVVDNFGASNARMRSKGRINGEPIVGKPIDHSRYLLVLTKPYDVAGLGVFNKQYDSGKLDDGWVYIKSIRRTRRTAGGKSWMDPQPKMDLLNDDNQGTLGMPAWFKSWEVLERRWVMAVVDSINPNKEHAIEDVLEMSPPYWNPNPKTQQWSPREVWVVKTVMPDEHPYGHRILYIDVNFPTVYMTENYDKKGEFWRLWRQSYAQVDQAGTPELTFLNTQTLDFQRKRATYIDISYMTNNVVSDDFFKPSALKKAAAGSLSKAFVQPK